MKSPGPCPLLQQAGKIDSDKLLVLLKEETGWLKATQDRYEVLKTSNGPSVAAQEAEAA